MNETINTILMRTGTTEYLTEQIKEEELNTILKCGIAAPNAYNAQNWHFSVVQNKEILDLIDRRTFEALDRIGDIEEEDQDYKPLYDAPTVIFISADETSDFAKQDCSCANENMAIAAKSLGIGSRYLDVPNMAFEGAEGAELMKKCQIPEGYRVVCSIALGYPSNPEEEAKQKNPDVISFIR